MQQHTDIANKTDECVATINANFYRLIFSSWLAFWTCCLLIAQLPVHRIYKDHFIVTYLPSKAKNNFHHGNCSWRWFITVILLHWTTLQSLYLMHSYWRQNQCNSFLLVEINRRIIKKQMGIFTVWNQTYKNNKYIISILQGPSIPNTRYLTLLGNS